MGALIWVDVELQNKGKRVVARGIVDTGAEGFAFVDSGIAAQIGLTQVGAPVPYAGVGGQTSLGFRSPLDRMTILDNPDCNLGGFKVLVGDMSRLSDIKILVGEDFIRSTKLIPEPVGESGWAIGCMKGEKIPIPEKISMTTWILIGGFALSALAIGAAFLLPQD